MHGNCAHGPGGWRMSEDAKQEEGRQSHQDDEAFVHDLRAAVRALDATEAELNAVRNPKRSALWGVVKRLRRRILGSR